MFHWAVAHFGQGPAGSPLNVLVLCILRHLSALGYSPRMIAGYLARQRAANAAAVVFARLRAQALVEVAGAQQHEVEEALPAALEALGQTGREGYVAPVRTETWRGRVSRTAIRLLVGGWRGRVFSGVATRQDATAHKARLEDCSGSHWIVEDYALGVDVFAVRYGEFINPPSDAFTSNVLGAVADGQHVLHERYSGCGGLGGPCPAGGGGQRAICTEGPK